MEYSGSMKAQRTKILLQPDPARVVARRFELGNRERVTKIIARIYALSDAEAKRESERLLNEFNGRHRLIHDMFLQRFEELKEYLISDQPPSLERQLLIGAYFIQEYALEAAALFNPSIVPHPDQSELEPGQLRFILSLRATGEGHISSIVFRTGSIDATGNIQVDGAAETVTSGKIVPDSIYDRALFQRKLHELGLDTRWARNILDELDVTFTWDDLNALVHRALVSNRYTTPTDRENASALLALARANYELVFEPGTCLSERVIFPHSEAESRGVEDARFVRFIDESGEARYYATYTAFDGRTFLPQLLETEDFLRFKVSTLNGPEVQNKGMALFPRKIGGRYAMISRQDNENVFLMYSDMPQFWYDKQLLMRPTEAWEFVQLGNCGSPIETSEGWLLLTHGVGYMRKYSIGAVLLDLEDPSRIIGRLRQPLLSPNEREREGYVPNVVYTCGGIVHAGKLILPYALSDQCSSFVTFDLPELIRELKAGV